MTEWIPCPACGTEHAPEAVACEICGYRLTPPAPVSALPKCARCGQPLGAGFEFCQICGLRVHSRRPRPTTQSMKLIPRRLLDGTGEVEPARPAIPDPGPRSSAVEPAAEAEAGIVPASPAPQPDAPVPNASPAEVAAESSTPAGRVEAADGGSWGQARVIPRGSSEDGAPVPRDTPGPGDTARMGQATPAAEQASVAVSGSPDGPSWSAPMARLAVESSRRSSGAAPLRIVLVKRDGSEGESVALRGALTIGRKQGDLMFPSDEFLSPAHARLEPAAGGGVRLGDLGSRNGVYVRISRPEPVFPGDLFLVGHHLLRLENLPPGAREQELDDASTRLFGTPMQPAWGRLTLIGVGGAEAEVHCLRAPQIVFGRELGDIIFPTDPFVSWQHAQLAMELRGDAMTVLLTDLRSANGTYLRIRGDVILQPGDMFRVGDQIFRVRMH
ncbi:FHA domain-containing protein [Nannocystis bainbridge]|uniref:FHA domain-containing protein n=1 Tax=Nannocystis bainbridge TaxID=2995303 RepID=A0ABT5DQG5_9BACT|nr:FHA domain-containing protein [Nannocystis bainbridge]MDC0715385.1 FHA domain-containing protein [Nannocystis bainbridge]